MKTKDEQKYQALLQATLDLVYETGLTGLKISHIVKRAGLGTGTFYVYFESKKALLHELYRHTKQESLHYLFKEYDEKLPFRVGFQKIILHYIQYRTEHEKEYFFMEQFTRSDLYKEVPQDFVQETSRPLLAILERGKAEQILKPYDNLILMSVILGIVKEVILQHIKHSIPLDEQRKLQIVTLCWDSIKY